MKIIEYSENIKRYINETKASDIKSVDLVLQNALERIINFIKKVYEQKKKIIFIGNGGSAAIASHMAVDFSKNGGIKAICFNEPIQLTCFSNDLGYENAFSYSVEMLGDEGDILIAISSSGSSQNILNAVCKAREKKCIVITFSGFNSNNPLRKEGDINLFVDNSCYGIVESVHAVLCHYILDMIIEKCRNA